MSTPNPEQDRIRLPGAPWRIAITGATGFIGTALTESLRREGHRVHRISRSRPEPGSDDLQWDPAEGKLAAADLEGLDAVVHLAGASIAKPWTATHKKRIRDSRVQGTRLLAETLARLERPPRVLVSASGAHYYGDRGDEVLTEESGPGGGFLAEVVREWEAAAEPAAVRGIRVVNTRSGIVLGSGGGVLQVMLLPFRLGLGGKLGSGRQWMSWIMLEDSVRVIEFALANEALHGPINTVAPNPVTNAEFTRTLGRVLGRPTVLSPPAAVLRLAGGQMAEELLLMSQRAIPERLREAGFRFRQPHLEGALRSAIGK